MKYKLIIQFGLHVALKKQIVTKLKIKRNSIMKFEIIRNEILVLFFLLFIIFDDHTFAAETDFKSTSEKINYQSYSAGQWKNGQQIYQAFCIHCHQTGIGPVILGRHYSTVALSLFVRHGINRCQHLELLK